MLRRRGARYDNDGNEGLNARRHKGQNNTTAPGLFVGDEIGGDHGLAVARPDGMEDAVDKRDAKQAPHRRSILLARFDEAGQRTVKGRLLGEDPAHQA